MKIRDDYHKFGAILDLIQQLCKPMSGMTYEEIMSFMGCGRKTAERTIKFLGERFDDALVVSHDIQNPKVLRFRLELPDNLPPEYISATDMTALNMAIKKIKNDDIKTDLECLEYKLNRILQEKKSVRELNDIEAMILSRTNTMVPYPRIKTDLETMQTLQRAVMTNTKVNVKYTQKDNTCDKRILCPLGFLYGRSNNYLAAYKDGDNKIIRTYILDKLSDITLTNERFNPGKFDINKYALESFGAYHSENGPYDVEWLADASVADAIERYTFHPTQKFIKNSDGSVVIKMRADGFEEMSWYLFQWGGKIKPIAPAELVNTYNNAIKKCASIRTDGLPPINLDNATKIILGTFPGEQSRETGRYYANTRNSFWESLGKQDSETPQQCLERLDIGLWDVIESCEISGSADKNIKNPVFNTLSRLPGEAEIYFNGKKAYKFFLRAAKEQRFDVKNIKEQNILPSSSPANTSKTKKDKWKKLLNLP